MISAGVLCKHTNLSGRHQKMACSVAREDVEAQLSSEREVSVADMSTLSSAPRVMGKGCGSCQGVRREALKAAGLHLTAHPLPHHAGITPLTAAMPQV